MQSTILSTNHLNQMLTNYWNLITATILSIWNYIEIKIGGAILLPIYVFFFNPEMANLALALFFLITFDLITGIYAAKKRGEAVTSNKAVKSAFKLGIYGILISTMHLTDLAVHLSNMSFNLEVGMIGFLAATEAISIIENAGKIGYAVPTKILNMLTDFTQKIETHTTSKAVSDDPNIEDVNITTDTQTSKSSLAGVETTNIHTKSKEVSDDVDIEDINTVTDQHTVSVDNK